jgi:hypothetical protein
MNLASDLGSRRLDPVTGKPRTVKDVLEHFEKCPECGQWVDTRDGSKRFAATRWLALGPCETPGACAYAYANRG